MNLISQLEKDIAFLTGPLTAGRLAGTEGAFRAANFLADELTSTGFQFAQGNSFMQELTVPVSYLTGPPRLQIGDLTLQYRQDFAEIPPMSTGGNFTGPLLVVRVGDSYSTDELKGKVALIAGRPPVSTQELLPG